MKKLIIILPYLFISSLVFAQSPQKDSLGIPVRVTNWGDRGLLVVESFFDDTKDSLIKRIGESEFERVRKYCSVFSWPEQIQGEVKFKRDTTAKRIFFEKLSKLKLYQIVSYQHYFQGEKKSRISIIKVPYNENKDWDKSAHWDCVYFVVQERSVKVL